MRDLRQLVRQRAYLVRQAARFKNRIHAEIGFYGALLILAEIDDVHRFRHSENLCAYAGLVPTVSQSASSVKYGSISKDGSALVIKLPCR